jgi:hypothetical protein
MSSTDRSYTCIPCIYCVAPKDLSKSVECRHEKVRAPIGNKCGHYEPTFGRYELGAR